MGIWSGHGTARARSVLARVVESHSSQLAEIRMLRRLTESSGPIDIGRLIRLGFLAPDIVESIIQGRQPAVLTAEGLTRHIEIPLEWGAQKAALDIRF